MVRRSDPWIIRSLVKCLHKKHLVPNCQIMSEHFCWYLNIYLAMFGVQSSVMLRSSICILCWPGLRYSYHNDRKFPAAAEPRATSDERRDCLHSAELPS